MGAIYDNRGNIKRMRIAAGLTQQQLANKIGVESKSFISALERDKGRPGNDTMPRLAHALDTTEQDLRFGEPGKASSLGTQQERILQMLVDELAPLSETEQLEMLLVVRKKKEAEKR